MSEVKHVPAKSFLVKTGLGSDFACNPYVGCTHACSYCYARFMGNHAHRPEPWGSYVEIKDYPNYDIPRNTGEKSVMFSSVTDPYQPIEKTAKRTRAILEEICESRLHVSFLTKSALILRDLDLFSAMANVTVGFSIALDDVSASVLEPGASLPSERIRALQSLHQAGIRTFVFIAPILPGITDVFTILDAVDEHSDFVMFDRLSLKHPENKANIFRYVANRKPELLGLYRNVFENKDSTYYDSLAQRIRDRAKERGRDYRLFIGKGE